MKRFLNHSVNAVFAALLRGGAGDAWDSPSEGDSVETPDSVSQTVEAGRSADYSELNMTAELKALITPEAANGIKASFSRLGAIRSISTQRRNSALAITSFRFTVHLDKGQIQGELAQDSSGQIAALRFLPAELGAHRNYVTRADVHLPFRGEWYATWGGTDLAANRHHREAGGFQTYAYDFLIKKGGATHRGRGLKNVDYYAYGQPILAPTAGHVVTVVDGVPDNALGQTNRLYVPGNCVIIDAGAGEFFVLAHLLPHRTAVEVGQQVAAGEVLGLCGNSGNSSEAHLHFHMQDGPDMQTANGLPITFRDFLQDGEPVASGIANGRVRLHNQGTF